MNTKHDLGLPSANKVSTYQQNTEERLPDTTWHTKSMLRKLLYFIWEERVKFKKDYERVLEESLILRRQRTEDLLSLNEKNKIISQQKDEIIDLYSTLNKEPLPLRVA